MNKEVLKKKELELNQNEEIIALLSAWKEQVELSEDEILKVSLVVRKSSTAAKNMRTPLPGCISQETWAQILSFDFWTKRERLVLFNHQKGQRYNEVMLSRDSCLEGMQYTRVMKDSELRQDWWSLHSSINLKFRQNELTFRVRFKEGAYGIFDTKSKD